MDNRPTITFYTDGAVALSSYSEHRCIYPNAKHVEYRVIVKLESEEIARDSKGRLPAPIFKMTPCMNIQNK